MVNRWPADAVCVRVAIVTESFPPDVNGVAHSVVRVAEHLVRRGHVPMVVAPAPRAGGGDHDWPYRVVRVASLPMPGYPMFRVGLPSRGRIEQALREHGTDVVHLASPFALGASGVSVAGQLGLPSVAVYQTDVANFAASYRLGLGRAAAWRWLRRIHNAAGRTLAPSTDAIGALAARGVQRIHLWRRGVDTARFHPGRRDEAWRAGLAPGGELLVGYVGRLAPEKRIGLLSEVAALPGVRLVLVGDGPARSALARALPDATFLGQLTGDELARAYASLDVFVHTGPHETFCQTVQEALASGVPAVVPAAGGPRDLVTPEVTGFWFPPGDAAALRSAVQVLGAGPDRRAAFGRAARESVAGRTWQAIGDELIGHYTAQIAAAAPARAA